MLNSKWSKRLGAWVFLALLVFQLTACQQAAGQSSTSDDGTASSYIFTMGTVFDIRVFADDAADIMQQTEQAIYGCDKLLSWREEGSLAYRFNTEHQADMSEIKEVLEDALRVSKDSKGAFDLTVLPLSQLWNFDRFGDGDFDVSTMKVPDQADISAAMKKVDYTQLHYDDQTGILSAENPDIQIELGAIGKGYAIEQAKNILTSSDASGGMISAGSSIYVYGMKKDGSQFRVALRDPRGDENSAIGVLTLSNTTISTSGDYERYFEKDGVRYHHILDPRTGYPADSGLMQVTIICDDSVMGDALSTACFVLGLDEGMQLAEKYGVDAIFVDTDKNIWYNNPDVLNHFEFMGESSGYHLNEYNQAHS